MALSSAVASLSNGRALAVATSCVSSSGKVSSLVSSSSLSSVTFQKMQCLPVIDRFPFLRSSEVSSLAQQGPHRCSSRAFLGEKKLKTALVAVKCSETATETDAPEAPAETYEYQAEVSRLMDLIVHRLYSHKEVFLCDLENNASDALDMLRFLSVTEPGLMQANPNLDIRIKTGDNYYNPENPAEFGARVYEMMPLALTGKETQAYSAPNVVVPEADVEVEENEEM